MKRVSLFLFWILLLGSFVPYHFPLYNGWDKMKLKGKVKSIEERSYQAVLNDGKIEAGMPDRNESSFKEKYDFQASFDRDGNQLFFRENYPLLTVSSTKWERKVKQGFEIEFISYLGDDLRDRYCFTYNKNGTIESDSHYQGKDNKFDKTTNYKYDEHGNVIAKSVKRDDGNAIAYCNYVYDSQGNILVETDSSKSGRSKKTIYDYDEKGNQLQERIFDANGNITKKITWTYYQNGNVQSKFEFNTKNSSLVAYATYFDSTKNKIKTIWYQDELMVVDKMWLHSFDSNNHVLKTVYYFREEIQDSTVYAYDELGNKIRENDYSVTKNEMICHEWKYNISGDLIEDHRSSTSDNYNWKTNYDYVYDEQGNWIQRIEYFQDQPKYVVKRTLLYW